MDAASILKAIATPLTNPGYPPCAYHFKNREYLNIVYETDEAALRAVIPEPLQIDAPTVRFEFMKMPDTTGLGSYAEAGQVLSVSFNGEKGDYLHAMYVSSAPAIASGRELSAYPKKSGVPNIYVDSDTLVGTLDYGTMRVASATMGYKWNPMSEQDAINVISRPNFMLKIVRGYGGHLDKCDLVRMPPLTDIRIKEAWTAPGRVQLFEHALAPVADLPVRKIISASHIIADLTLAPVTPVYNYLEKK